MLTSGYGAEPYPPPKPHSTNIQVKPAVAVATCVTSIAIPAPPFAATADPALNPNQPTHNNEVPIKLKSKLCGRDFFFRSPKTIAATRPAKPQLI